MYVVWCVTVHYSLSALRSWIQIMHLSAHGKQRHWHIVTEKFDGLILYLCNAWKLWNRWQRTVSPRQTRLGNAVCINVRLLGGLDDVLGLEREPRAVVLCVRHACIVKPSQNRNKSKDFVKLHSPRGACNITVAVIRPLLKDRLPSLYTGYSQSLN
jgi:hypothetical protein